MPNILDYETAADWQEAWQAWNESRAAERQARIRAARSNAAKRGAQTKRAIAQDAAWHATRASSA